MSPHTDAGELLKLIEAGERHADGLSAQLDNPNWTPRRSHIEQARNSIKKLAEIARQAASHGSTGGEAALRQALEKVRKLDWASDPGCTTLRAEVDAALSRPSTGGEAETCCKGLAPPLECRCEIERKAAGHPPYQRGTIDSVSSCGQENDYRRASGRPVDAGALHAETGLHFPEGPNVDRTDRPERIGAAQAAVTRDEIAKIIAPDWFDQYSHCLNNYENQHIRFQNDALERADKIIALLGLSVPSAQSGSAAE